MFLGHSPSPSQISRISALQTVLLPIGPANSACRSHTLGNFGQCRTAFPAWSAHVAALEQWQTPGRPDWLSPMRIHTFRFGLRHSAGRFSAATRAWPSFATFSARAFSTRIRRNILGTAWLKWKRPKPFQSTCQDEAFSRGSGVTGRSLHTALARIWIYCPNVNRICDYICIHPHPLVTKKVHTPFPLGSVLGGNRTQTTCLGQG